MSLIVQVESHISKEMITYNFANWSWYKSYGGNHVILAGSFKSCKIYSVFLQVLARAEGSYHLLASQQSG